MNKTDKRIVMTTELTLLGSFLIMVLFFSIRAPYFFTIKNFLNIGLYSSIIGISAVGMTMILLLGHIDVSVGAVMGLVGVVAAILFRNSLPIGLVFIISLGIGLVAGLVNGFLVTRMKISSLIVTLATMTIFRGMGFVFCGGLSIVITEKAFKFLGRGYFLKIPISFIVMIAFYIIFAFLLKNTAFGRRIYASGGNSEASYYSGINVRVITLVVFILNGFMAALGGLIMASQTGSGLPRAGQGYEMDVIAATVLGGTSLNGGKGKLHGTLIGVLIMVTLTNGMVLMNIPSFYQEIAKGCVLLLAVMLDSFRTARNNKD